ncbi:MAG: Protein GrpE [Ignavibacteria bacterium]|nr:Protein GrpE [Ignavibacteria bacterium]
MSSKKHNINIKDAKQKNPDEGIIENGKEITPENDESVKEINSPETEAAKLKEMLLRKAAEFENYKKRTENEISNYIKYASENIIKELIPVFDDLGRSVESVDKGETKDFETLKKGLHHIYDKFKKVLEKEGLKEINSGGKEFDVEVNSALMQIPRDDVKPNTVIEVVEKGYKLKDKVIKHEKVLVSSEPEKN